MVPKYMSHIDLDNGGDRNGGVISYIANFEMFGFVNYYTIQQPQNFVSPSSYNFGQGKSKGKDFSKPNVVCQICGKNGCTTFQCYHRFDITYVGNIPLPQTP